MLELTAVNIISSLTALFFFAGSIINFIAPANVVGDFKRWGFPPYFYYITAVMEGLSAILVLIPATRSIGAALGTAVMLAATVTVLRHKEYGHSLVPLLIIAACIAIVSLG